MVKPIAKALDAVVNRRVAAICRAEFEDQKFHRLNERPVEYAFAFRVLSRECPHSVLDVGTGTTSLPDLMRTCGFVVTAIDNVRDYWPQGMVNRHFHVIDDDITATRLTGPYDAVTCISVLEHIERADDAVANMLSVLRPGGHLLLTFPYSEDTYVRNVYELPGSSYGQDFAFITQSFCRADIDRWLERHDGVIIEQEYWQFWEGKHWTVGDEVIPPRRSQSEGPHQISCLVVRKEGKADGT